MGIWERIYEDAKQNSLVTFMIVVIVVLVFFIGIGTGIIGSSVVLDYIGLDIIQKNTYITLTKLNENYVEKSEFTKLKESVNNSIVLNSKLLQTENAFNEEKRALEKCQIQNNQLLNESQLLNTKISNFNQQSQLEEQKKAIYRQMRILSNGNAYNEISPTVQKQIDLYAKEVDQIQAQILNLINQNIK